MAAAAVDDYAPVGTAAPGDEGLYQQNQESHVEQSDCPPGEVAAAAVVAASAE